MPNYQPKPARASVLSRALSGIGRMAHNAFDDFGASKTVVDNAANPVSAYSKMKRATAALPKIPANFSK